MSSREAPIIKPLGAGPQRRPAPVSAARAAEAPKSVDVLVPAYNEADSIGSLIEEVFRLARDRDFHFRMIVVDDGSADRTHEIVAAYAARYPITLLSLSRNFGKEAAILAGLDVSEADATIIMDADLQHPVDLIPQLLERWREGYDCVYGVKSSRHDESLVKRAFTRLFYAFVNQGMETRIEPNALDFRLLDRAVVRALRSMRERVRFMKGLYSWIGYRTIGIPFVPDKRHAGRSKFSFAKLFRLGWDGLTSFSDFPLRLAGFVGASISSLSVIYAIYITLRTLIWGVDVPGWATLTVAVTFLSGVNILFLGVLGQYVRNIYLETKNRPNYIVRESILARKEAREPDFEAISSSTSTEQEVSPPAAAERG